MLTRFCPLLCLLLCLPTHADTPPSPEAPASVPPADSGGMVMTGWRAVAEQALGDLRGVVLQRYPAPPAAPGPVPAATSAAPVIAAFVRSGSQPGSSAWVNSLWQASLGNQVVEDSAADRIARGFTVGNAAQQLGRGVYGGPAGVAAYAAWWAYRQPGASAEQALRVGLFSGAAVWDAEKTSSSDGPPAEDARRAALAGALGGVAIAAAGGDERALREQFFDTGAVVLLQDNAQPHCLSARVQCQQPPAGAAKDLGFSGWALDQMAPAAPPMGVAWPAAAGPGQAVLPQAQGALALGGGWALAWQAPAGVPRGTLYATVVLSQGGNTVAAAAPAPAAVAPAAAPALASGRYSCARGNDTRAIWVEPGAAGGQYVCRTMYQVGETKAVLWNAQQNPEVCSAKAQARVAKDQSQGFRCQPVEQGAAGL
ncbi:hypothetical protein [Pseudomonas sp. NPDC007930]|uniref:hypothetical protein n=1 Tax=Pseudomonas sp. NPDC007930 TaxID=3364417 RepID=UPI0036E2EC2E